MIADLSEPAKRKRNFRYELEVSDISDSELVTMAMEAEKAMSTSVQLDFTCFMLLKSVMHVPLKS